MKLIKPAVLLSLAILAITAAVAVADTDRATYVATVEPICQKNSQANDKNLNGVHKLVKQGKLKPAGVKFLKAAAALTATQKQLAAVEQPSADASRLNAWLADISKEATLLKQAGTALKGGNKNKASSLTIKLDNDTKQANALVVSFGFHYCKGKPSSSYS